MLSAVVVFIIATEAKQEHIQCPFPSNSAASQQVGGWFYLSPVLFNIMLTGNQSNPGVDGILRRQTKPGADGIPCSDVP